MRTFEELFDLDISNKVRKYNGLDHLNWLDCLLLLRGVGMKPTYDVSRIHELSNGQVIVTVWVQIGEVRHEITYTDIRTRDFEFIKQRAFVKCVAINWGLGLRLWEKDNDPAVDDDAVSEKIMLVFGQLIGPKFTDANSLLEYIRHTDKSLGKLLKSGAIEEKRAMLSRLTALLTEDEPF